MIGLIFVTHGNLAREFLSVLEHVVGPQKNIGILCIHPQDDMEQKRLELQHKITQVDQGKGVIILTDMFGGTPSNIALTTMHKDQVEVLAGMNLPMLVKLMSLRVDCNLKDAVHHAQEAGKKYIHLASTLLK